MKRRSQSAPSPKTPLPRCPTGIQGLDEITEGGLPLGRSTLVCGGAGCGKTLFGVEFLVHGATRFGEPGVFMSFEESEEDLLLNMASLGFELSGLVRRKKLVIDHVHVERSQITVTGEFDLEGLFARLNYAIDSIGAKRVVLDTLEALFAGIPNEGILRAELRRLFGWLKEKGVTSIITAERGTGQLTRNGLEEYVSDCVILLDHRVSNQVATRHLRVVKYRGALHGTNEFPFLIGTDGLSVLPITSLGLNHKVSRKRVSTGIPRLDAMLGGRGFFRGSSILLTGTAGTGKTSVAAHFAEAAARRGERVIFFSFEESPNQIVRNMRSIGLHLEPLVERDLLRFRSVRPTLFGLEMHLASMFHEIRKFRPAVVVVDPITSLITAGTSTETKGMVTRLVDFLKQSLITTFFTSLTHGGHSLQQSEIAMSSLMDSWLLLQDFEGNGERNRVLYVLKARGMSHSNQVREFVISSRGIDLVDAYIGLSGVLTGASRVAQTARESAEAIASSNEIARRRRELGRKRETLEQRIAALRSDFESEEQELRRIDEQTGAESRLQIENQGKLASLRRADKPRAAAKGKRPSAGRK